MKIDFDELFLMTDDIPRCSNCGSRTEILLDLSHTKDSTQVHKCLSPDCELEFVLVADLNIS